MCVECDSVCDSQFVLQHALKDVVMTVIVYVSVVVCAYGGCDHVSAVEFVRAILIWVLRLDMHQLLSAEMCCVWHLC